MLKNFTKTQKTKQNSLNISCTDRLKIQNSEALKKNLIGNLWEYIQVLNII